MVNDIALFLASLPSIDQDRFAMIMQGLALQTAPGTIEAMEAELKKLKEEIERANAERDRMHREQDEVVKIIKAIDAEIAKKPTSVELRLLRLVLSQKASKLEEEIGVKRPYKSLQRKCTLRREIDHAKQLAEIMALTGGVRHGR